MGIRVATAALTGRIFAGHPLKSGQGFREPRYDVTSDCLKAVAEHIGMDRKAEVCIGDIPQFEITIRSITPKEARADAAREG